MSEFIDLTKEEIENVYIAAKEGAKEGNDFYDCFRIAHEALQDKKRETLRNQEIASAQDAPSVQEEPSIMPVQSPTEQPEQDMEETDIDMNPEMLSMIMKQDSEEILRLSADGAKLAEDLNLSPIEIYMRIHDASNGMLSPKFIDDYQQKLGDQTKGFFDIVRKINSIARRRYYMWCTYSSDEAMTQAKAGAISMYEQLNAQGEAVHQALDASNGWNNEAATIVVKSYIDSHKSPELNHLIGLERVGQYDIEGHFDYPPESYDLNYFVTMHYLRENTQGNFHNKRMFEESQSIVNKELEGLKGMPISEYRKHRVDLMLLLPGEKTLFDSQIRELAKNKSESDNYAK